MLFIIQWNKHYIMKMDSSKNTAEVRYILYLIGFWTLLPCAVITVVTYCQNLHQKLCIICVYSLIVKGSGNGIQPFARGMFCHFHIVHPLLINVHPLQIVFY